MRLDPVDQEADCVERAAVTQAEAAGGFERQRETGLPPVAADRHGLVRLVGEAGPRLEVIGRGQLEVLAIPEERVDARIVVGVARRDVVEHALVELRHVEIRPAGRLGEHPREVLVARVARKVLGEPEQLQPGHEVAPRAGLAVPVEAAEEHHVALAVALDLGPGGLAIGVVRQVVPEGLGPHDVALVAPRRELRDEVLATPPDQRFRPGAADRHRVFQDVGQGAGNGQPLVDQRDALGEQLERRVWRLAPLEDRPGSLEGDRADPSVPPRRP